VSEQKEILTIVRSAYRETSYEQFLEDRKQGVGSSDIADVMDKGDYGCRRRFFLDRLGFLPAKPEKMQYHLERGKFFEEPVARLYAKQGHVVRTCGTGYIKEWPMVRANADRLQRTKIDNWGILEIKAPASGSFRKVKKEGLPISWELQAQYQMLCYGTTWGTVAVYWPDGHELKTFNLERDEELCENIKTHVLYAWGLLEGAKKRIEQEPISAEGAQNIALGLAEAKRSDSTACSTCAAFDLCHPGRIQGGADLRDDSLSSAAASYFEANAAIKILEEEKDEAKAKLRDTLDKSPCDKLLAGPYVIQISERTRTSLDAKEVQKSLPENIFQACHKSVKYDVFTVKEGK